MRLRLAVVLLGVALNLAFVDAAVAKDRPPSAKKSLAYVVATPVAAEQDSSALGGGGVLSTERVAGSGCREQQFRVSGHNIFGWRLFTYVRWVYWCWNGSYLTYLASRAWGEVYMPGWSFRGTLNNSWSIGGRGYTYYRVWSQGHFCLVEYFSCIQNSYPWIDVTVYPGGGWRWSHGG